ncbi:Retrovirus-related Pol polyprotein [Quillaja saponaria]|uniref:Retrovirus-related Pol polyprotein n=1 Tax=Quillaja saponaria TaxID=32244 RepID=A0AAD7PYW6_QUISA|nr:Retrovirus-related Pol polyprotein [Quillaja saponaria]
MDDAFVDVVMALQAVPYKYGEVFHNLPISHKKLLPFVLYALVLELKPLPDHLKYMFLDENNTLPVIIVKNLTDVQEERLVRVLRGHKIAIGWTLVDIKGISPSMCMHRILLEENRKPTREM